MMSRASSGYGIFGALAPHKKKKKKTFNTFIVELYTKQIH